MQGEGVGRTDEAMDDLRAVGQRVTPARRAVVAVLAASAARQPAEHLGTEAIVARAADLAPGVHRATVYRALTTLTELGLVSHTHVSGGAAVYHLAARPDRPTRERPVTGRTHAHLQCVTCGRIIDIPTTVFDPVQAELETGYGFALDPGHVALLGTCADCRPSP